MPNTIHMELQLTGDNLSRFKIAQGSYGWNLEVVVISSDQQPIALTGCTVRLRAMKADNTTGYYDGVVSRDGITATWIVSEQLTAVVGSLSLAIEVSKPNTSALITIPCTGVVVDAGDNRIQSADDYQAAARVLGDVQAATEAANTAADAANTAAGRADTATGNAADAAVNANRAANASDGAAESANDAANNAGTATTAANAAADKANRASDRANTAAEQCEGIVSGDLGPAVDAVLATKYDKTGGPVKYDTYEGHINNRENPHGVTAAQTGAVASITVGGVAQPKSGTTVALPAYPASLPASGGNADSVGYKRYEVGAREFTNLSCQNQYGAFYSGEITINFGRTLSEAPWVFVNINTNGVSTAEVIHTSTTQFTTRVINGVKTTQLNGTLTYFYVFSIPSPATLQTAYHALAGLPADADVGDDPEMLQEAVNTITGGTI